MIGPSLPTDDRLLELLALRAVEGIEPDALEELGEWSDCDLLDQAAGVLAVGMVSLDLEPLPSTLRASLERAALSLSSGASPSPDSSEPRPETLRIQPASSRTEARTGWLGAGGWLVAAASILLAVLAWTGGRTPLQPDPANRADALASRQGVVRTEWLGLDDASLAESPHRFDAGLKGEVIWDPKTHEGYMIFEGLAANDPTEYQYQLWIFDATRPTGDLPQYGDGILSQRPVDGGVFDATSPGRVVVPIHAKLPVGKAAIFAVTVEPPGGVVVSDRDIVALAVAE